MVQIEGLKVQIGLSFLQIGKGKVQIDKGILQIPPATHAPRTPENYLSSKKVLVYTYFYKNNAGDSFPNNEPHK